MRREQTRCHSRVHEADRGLHRQQRGRSDRHDLEEAEVGPVRIANEPLRQVEHANRDRRGHEKDQCSIARDQIPTHREG